MSQPDPSEGARPETAPPPEARADGRTACTPVAHYFAPKSTRCFCGGSANPRLLYESSKDAPAAPTARTAPAPDARERYVATMQEVRDRIYSDRSASAPSREATTPSDTQRLDWMMSVGDVSILIVDVPGWAEPSCVIFAPDRATIDAWMLRHRHGWKTMDEIAELAGSQDSERAPDIDILSAGSTPSDAEIRMAIALLTSIDRGTDVMNAIQDLAQAIADRDETIRQLAVRTENAPRFPTTSEVPTDPLGNREENPSVVSGARDDAPTLAPIATMDYPAAARSIALNLQEFCDESLPFPDMIAEAARRAHSALLKLQARHASAVRKSAARKRALRQLQKAHIAEVNEVIVMRTHYQERIEFLEARDKDRDATELRLRTELVALQEQRDFYAKEATDRAADAERLNYVEAAIRALADLMEPPPQPAMFSALRIDGTVAHAQTLRDAIDAARFTQGDPADGKDLRCWGAELFTLRNPT